MVFSLFFCRLSMPPKHSSPSAWAAAIAAGGEPPHKKSRRVALWPNPTNRDSSYVASTDQSAPLSSTAPVWSQPISFFSGILGQLVAWMADAVTRHLSPPNKTSTTPINNTSRPSALSEVLLVSNPPPQTVVSQCLVYQLQLQEWLVP